MSWGNRIKYGVIAVLVFLLFLAQWYYSGVIEDLRGQIEVIKFDAQQAEIEALDRQREIEHEWQAKADQAAKNVTSNLAEIHEHYDWVVAGLDFDGLRTADPGHSETALPAVTTDSSGVGSTGSCRCPRQNTRDIKTALLTVARDCDITAAKYNELLRLWQGVLTSDTP